MTDLICKCGHSVDYHNWYGCHHINDQDDTKWCGCTKTAEGAKVIALTADRDRLAGELAQAKRQAMEAIAKMCNVGIQGIEHVAAANYPERETAALNKVYAKADELKAAFLASTEPKP
jgi:hypothetical protein